MKLSDLTAERQRDIYNNVALKTGLPPASIEKDWWVTQVLSDRIEEISEDLEADFGKPYNVSEDNSRYMLSLIEENMIAGVINPDLQEPSLDAMATTTMAIYKYPNIPWRE